MTESSMSRQWLRRYKLYFFIGLLLLCIQLFLGYLLPIFGTTGDIYDTNPAPSSLYGSLVEKRNARRNKAVFSELFQENPSIDDEDIINSNSIFNFKDVSVISKTSSSTKDHTEGINSNNNLNNNTGNTAQIPTHLQLDDLKFKPICDIVTKEAISAIYRARTQHCKETIANITCAIQIGEFYPKQLPNYCPHKPYSASRAMGCYKDDKKFRTLSGYYINSKTTNTPKKCIQMCLQSGFVYAGVQYSTECFCGNTISDDGIKLPDPQCNYKCSGDSKQICGGYFTMNIFETGIKKFSPQIAELIPKSDEPKIKIAFLLTLNGRAVRQVYRLLKLLYSDQHFYYIHVDARQDYMYRELLKLEQKTNNIRLARKRYSTIWGGASLLRMLLMSMTDLLQNSNWQWDFVINLSESDFLVKTTENLVDFLTANRNRNFVKSHGREVQRFIQKQGLDKTFVECDTHMWRIGDRELPFGIQIDGGSDWVALSRDFVKYVTSDNGTQDKLIIGLLRIFHHTLLPAESFFHTALRNSKFCDSYVDNNLHVTNWKRRLGCKCQYKHVVDWCGCSPNDFKPDDWSRLLATEDKQTFFARKFEPIINQAVILQLEEWLIGPYPVEYQNLHSYWQSVYHYQDKSPKIDQSFITVASSLACQRLHTNYSLKAILEMTVFMDHDHYKGFLIHHEIAHTEDESKTVQLEVWAKSQQFGEVSRATALGKRIKSIEISTEFDQKEQLARNYLKIMGLNSEPTFILHLTAANSDSKVILVNNYNLTVLWVNPAGHLSDISEIYVDVLSPLQLVPFSKSSLKPPLLPGMWTAKLVNKHALIAQCNFLIIPPVHDNTTITIDQNWSQIKQLTNKNYQKQWDLLLPDSTQIKLLEEKALKNSKLIDDEQIKWINKLISKFFIIKNICVINGTEPFENVEKCNETNWSSYAPDPKSEIFTNSDSIKR